MSTYSDLPDFFYWQQATYATTLPPPSILLISLSLSLSSLNPLLSHCYGQDCFSPLSILIYSYWNQTTPPTPPPPAHFLLFCDQQDI